MKRLYTLMGFPAVVSCAVFPLFLCSDATCAETSVVAKYAIEVTAPVAAEEKTLPPGFERVGGKRAITLGPMEKGMKERAVALTVDTYIFLKFPAELGRVVYTIDPSHGIVEPPPGLYSLPKDVVGILRAINPGKVTITVAAFAAGIVAAGGNPSGGRTPSWSGYAQVGGPFTGITGAWNVPAVSNDAGGGYSVTWVGIDGFGNSSLIQAGTEQDYSSGNFLGIGDGPSYHAWWEILPAGQTAIPFPVSPGDQMIVSISPVGGTATPNVASNWSISIYNQTKGWAFNTTQSYSGPLATAEWIEEAPSNCFTGGCVLPLVDYGSVTFDVYDWLAGAASPKFVASQALSMTGADGVTIISTPSNPDGDADGFTVAFGSSVPSPPGPFVTTTSLSDAVLNQPYQQALHASGPSVTDWTGTGSIPPGLNLDGSSGAISGVPKAVGTFSFTVSALQASEAGVSTQKQPLTLTVLATAPPPPSPDFRLSAQPMISQWTYTNTGCTSTETIVVLPLNGFTQSVSLSASNLPSGVTASFSSPTTQHTSTLTLSSSPCVLDSMAAGTRAFVTVTGTSGGLSHVARVEIINIEPVQHHCNKPGGCPNN